MKRIVSMFAVVAALLAAGCGTVVSHATARTKPAAVSPPAAAPAAAPGWVVPQAKFVLPPAVEPPGISSLHVVPFQDGFTEHVGNKFYAIRMLKVFDILPHGKMRPHPGDKFPAWPWAGKHPVWHFARKHRDPLSPRYLRALQAAGFLPKTVDLTQATGFLPKPVDLTDAPNGNIGPWYTPPQIPTHRKIDAGTLELVLVLTYVPGHNNWHVADWGYTFLPTGYVSVPAKG